MSEDPLLDSINAFIAERYEFFMENVYPKAYKIFETILNSPEFDHEKVKGYHDMRFSMNGLKFSFYIDYAYVDKVKTITRLKVKIKHKFRTVLYFNFWKGSNVELNKFHECEWIEKLDDIPRQISLIEAQLREKKLRKHCKDFEKRCD